MNHPESAEWIEFLYGECTAQRKRELEAHLANCSNCAAQLKSWQGTARSLDAWRLPTAPAAAWLPTHPWRWAAAAAIILFIGFWVGHQLIASRTELAALRKSVAQLTDLVQSANAITFSNSVLAATSAANEHTLQLLTEYGRFQEAKQTADLEALGLELADFRTRLTRLRAELETVAVNTENSFEQTHESLNRVVAISSQIPDQTGDAH
jgi:hypothetical protein